MGTVNVRKKDELQAEQEQAARDRLARRALRAFDKHDAQQQEYSRDTRMGNTASADSYTYTTRDGVKVDGAEEGGQAVLDAWGHDLKNIIREAEDGSSDPEEELPGEPS